MGVRTHDQSYKEESSKSKLANMTKTIAAQWNGLDAVSKLYYERMARREKLVYKKALSEWKKERRELLKQQKDSPKTTTTIKMSTKKTSTSRKKNKTVSSSSSSSLSKASEEPQVTTKVPASTPLVRSCSPSSLSFGGMEDDRQRVQLYQGIDTLALQLQADGVDFLVHTFCA